MLRQAEISGSSGVQVIADIRICAEAFGGPLRGDVPMLFSALGDREVAVAGLFVNPLAGKR